MAEDSSGGGRSWWVTSRAICCPSERTRWDDAFLGWEEPGGMAFFKSFCTRVSSLVT